MGKSKGCAPLEVLLEKILAKFFLLLKKDLLNIEYFIKNKGHIDIFQTSNGVWKNR